MAHKTETKYHAHPVDQDGYATYSDEENKVWHDLIVRQTPLVQNRACDEYLQGLDILNLQQDRIPQCPEISKALQSTTGWVLEPVPALIPSEQFFHLLANKKFPAATFIRNRDELDYIQEPDIFHEIFGHCPLLTNKPLSEFTQTYGKLCENANADERDMLARLYWFTVEFGLINTKKGLRTYGGGILSSKSETPYSIDSDIPLRKPFDVIDVFRTPYLIYILQPVYFVIDSFDVLFELTEMDLIGLAHEAKQLGMHKPLYNVTLENEHE
jgi:phenylalanine-4-hydroxylase